jgi:hypothetical protein
MCQHGTRHISASEQNQRKAREISGQSALRRRRRWVPLAVKTRGAEPVNLDRWELLQNPRQLLA